MKFLIISVVVLALYLFTKRADLIAISAKTAYGKGNTEKSLKKFRIAEKLGTLSISNMLLYGYILLRSGELDEARTTLAAASMMKGKEQIKNRIKAMRALVMWKEGNLKDAIESLEELVKDFKNTAVYQDLGLLYILDGNKEKALSFNLEAYDYNSDDLVIMDNLAEAYALCGKLEEAEKVYTELLEKEPHFPEAYYGYGFLLIEKGGEDNRQKGIELIRTSLDKRFSFLSVLQKDEVEDLLKKYE